MSLPEIVVDKENKMIIISGNREALDTLSKALRFKACMRCSSKVELWSQETGTIKIRVKDSE